MAKRIFEEDPFVPSTIKWIHVQEDLLTQIRETLEIGLLARDVPEAWDRFDVKAEKLLQKMRKVGI